MLRITFVPESPAFDDSTKQYTAIWKRDGERVFTVIEARTKLAFTTTNLEATVYEGISQSHPLKFRASYDEDTKKATIVHELLHILSDEHQIALPVDGEDLSLGLHKQINLVLYDLWVELYGVALADKEVAIESNRSAMYQQAWEWALSFSADERQQQFSLLL